MIYLSEVTLICVSSVQMDKVFYSFQKSTESIKFGEVKLVSHKKPDNLPDFISFEETYEIKSKDEYSYYCIYNLTNNVNTSHCLVIQPDSFVINPGMWDNSWLEYDYIGAPWQFSEEAYIDPFGNHQRVGNGGFSLRSKKLLDVPKNAYVHFDVNYGNFYKHMDANQFAEDGNICVHNRHIYETLGCKFAPVDVAARFSHERQMKETEDIKPFGFHSILPPGTQL